MNHCGVIILKCHSYAVYSNSVNDPFALRQFGSLNFGCAERVRRLENYFIVNINIYTGAHRWLSMCEEATGICTRTCTPGASTGVNWTRADSGLHGAWELPPFTALLTPRISQLGAYSAVSTTTFNLSLDRHKKSTPSRSLSSYEEIHRDNVKLSDKPFFSVNLFLQVFNFLILKDFFLFKFISTSI